MKNNKFCHLHLHNEYSVLDGLGSAEDYAKKASDLGFKYLGITNHGNIDGLIKFQKACKENNIHPILGCEAYIVPSLYKKEKGEHRGHVTLLVKNQDGFENLCMMLTKANLEGFYHRPRIDFDLLYDRCDGLVILTGCLDTFINLKGGVDLFYDLSEKLRDDLYLEVMPHNISLQTKVNKMMLDIFHNDRNRYKLVATNDCHYIEKHHSETQEVLLAIQSKAKWTDPNRWKFNITGLHLRTADEMIEAFTNQNILTDDDIDDAILNTIEVAEKCAAFEIKKQKIFLPKVPGYNVKNVSDYLYDLCCEKLKKIKKYALHEVYINRLETEFDLIEKKGFIPYFMIVYDLVKWCKENDIMVGPGRGSVGGSLMAYLLGITTVDPIRYNLLFSRFIAEDRNDLPDIDLDFEDSKRHLVRERLEELYGKNNISSISTFLSMKGKAAIRDVGRVFDVPLKDVDEFSKSIVYEEDKAIEEACIKTDIGKEFDKKYPEVCDHAIILEGTIRGNGQHAAAVIISADDLRKGTKGNLVNRNNIIVSNWDMEDSEYVGLMKLDVLGLNTLSILNETKRLIKTNHNVDIDYEKIPLDDQNIYREISAGNNVGVFQINTWSTTKLAKEVSPDSIELLSDVIALVRPGSMDAGMTDEYIRRRNGKTWKKKHPIYEKIMESTYGVMVYQEQVMDVIHKVAGLPYTTADKIRKIIAKKHDVKLFAPFKKQFIEGCLEKKTLSEKEAKEFWEALQAHGKYSFNKSHATEYAIIGYWCAYVKYYYPTEFICANLIHGSETKKEELIEEAKRLGLKLVLPKVGISDAFRWAVKENKLYVPFIEIKGVGEKTAEACMSIKAKGNKKGFFESVQVQEKKTKIEKILEQIGAFGNDPTGDVEEYFTFTVNGRVNHKKGYSKIFQKTLPVNERVLSCERCELCQECSSPVLPSPGYFNIMICGEAPGKDEDRLGKGFVGKSGQDVLWPALKEHGLKRSDFHITNVCKCFIDPNVQIITSKGHKAIKEIKIGDLVLTHKGKFQKVNWIKPEEKIGRGDKIVKIRFFKSNTSNKKQSITVTPEHPFMCNNKWTKAINLKKGDKLKVLSKPCLQCGLPMPVTSNSNYCSRKCMSIVANQKQWDNPQRHIEASKLFKRLYSEGILDKNQMTKNANSATRKKIKDGTFHLLKGNNRPKCIWKGKTKYNCESLMRACEKAYKTKLENGSMDKFKNAGKKALKKYYKTHQRKINIKNKFTKIESIMSWALRKRNINDFYQNKYLFGYYPDFLFEKEKIIIECDGLHFHSSDKAKERDKKRDMFLLKKGYTTLRFTEDQIKNDVFSCVDEFERIRMNHLKEYNYVDAVIDDVKFMTNHTKKTLYNFGVEKDNSYIANGIVSHNCYPSKSKTPTREHITKCKRWLENEIEHLKPALILAFGNTGLKAFTNKEAGITDLNSKIEWNDKYQTYICWCIHPSAVLRNPSNKKLFVEAIDAFVDKIKELGGI